VNSQCQANSKRKTT